jgi:hypothetical protein
VNSTPTFSLRLWLGTAATFIAALVPLVATLGDPGITWDEPVYRESQRLQAEWFALLAGARSWDDLGGVLSREATHDLWMSARYGLNFHPPLAGMLANFTHLAFGGWMHELNARRLASALELAAAAAMLFGFLGRRYGLWVGAVAAASLLLMPRVFGHGHIAGTDMPMLLFWAAASLAFWKGQSSRSWRAGFAVLIALAFLVKLSSVFVLVPLGVWHVVFGGRANERRGDIGPRGDASVSPAAPLLSQFVVVLLLAAPLLFAGWESYRLAEAMRLEVQGRLLPYAADEYFQHLNLLESGVSSRVPGSILLIPAVTLVAIWLGSRAARRVPSARTWLGPVGPGFETLLLMLAVGPVVVLGLNPGWWRDTLLRIGHYFALFVDRRAALPDIEIFYLGQKYVYSLPWHNGWVLTAVTIPIGILLLSIVGCLWAVWRMRRDALPMLFLFNAAALPIARMLPTPAHDGVRLMLPTFFFLAGLAGMGFGVLAGGRVSAWAGRRVGEWASGRVRWVSGLRFQVSGSGSRVSRSDPRPLTPDPRPLTPDPRPLVPVPMPRPVSAAVACVLLAVCLGPAVYDVLRIHPYHLSYYNSLVGGLPGAMRRGFEVTYWYDAVTPRAVADINRWLPRDARIEIHVHTDVFGEWRARGHPPLRADIKFHTAASGPRFVFLLTHSSKSNPTTRLLFAQRPAFPAVEHAGVRLFSIYDSAALARAQALDLLTAAVSEQPREADPRMEPPRLSEKVLAMAQQKPAAVLAGAELLAHITKLRQPSTDDADVAAFLAEVIPRDSQAAQGKLIFLQRVANSDPNALQQAARILVDRPQDVRRIILAEGYLPVEDAAGYLDKDIPP